MVTDKPEQPGLGRGARADSLPGWARRATAAGYRVLPGLVAAFTVAAIAALGMKASLRELATVGWRPLSIVIAETAFLAVLVVAGIHWLAAFGLQGERLSLK